MFDRAGALALIAAGVADFEVDAFPAGENCKFKENELPSCNGNNMEPYLTFSFDR